MGNNWLISSFEVGDAHVSVQNGSEESVVASPTSKLLISQLLPTLVPVGPEQNAVRQCPRLSLAARSYCKQ